MSPNCHRNVTLMSPNIYYRRDNLSTFKFFQENFKKSRDGMWSRDKQRSN